MIDVVTAVFLKNNSILLAKPRSSMKSNKYTLIGGKVKDGEDYKDAIIREVKEELKIDLTKAELNLILEFEEVSASDPDLKINMHMFIANREVLTLPNTNEEILDYRWYDINDNELELSDSIKNHLIPYLKTLLKK